MADAAFLLVGLLVSQQEFEQRKEREWDVRMYFFISFLFFFHVQSEEIADGFVEHMIFFDSVSLMQLHSVNPCFECDAILAVLRLLMRLLKRLHFQCLASFDLPRLGMRIFTFILGDFFGFGLCWLAFGAGGLSILCHLYKNDLL